MDGGVGGGEYRFADPNRTLWTANRAGGSSAGIGE